MFHRHLLFLPKTHHIRCCTQSLPRDTNVYETKETHSRHRQTIHSMNRNVRGARRNCARATTLVPNNYIVHKLAGCAMYTISTLELLARECTILISPASSYMLVNWLIYKHWRPCILYTNTYYTRSCNMTCWRRRCTESQSRRQGREMLYVCFCFHCIGLQPLTRQRAKRINRRWQRRPCLILNTFAKRLRQLSKKITTAAYM